MSHSVLVLDESSPIQGLITSALADSELDVYHEQQPERFFETAKSITPDLIFISNSDEKQGYGVCQKFKEDLDLENVPLIVLAKSSDEVDSAKLKELKIDGFLRKPFEASLLQEHVKQFIPTAFLPSEYDDAQSLESQPGEDDVDGRPEEISVLEEEVLDLIKEQAGEPEVNEDDVPEVDFSDEVAESLDEEKEEEQYQEETTMMHAVIDTDGIEDELVFSEVSDELETIDVSEFEELDLEEVGNFDEYEEISLDSDEEAPIMLEEEEVEEISVEEEESIDFGEGSILDEEEEGLSLDDDEIAVLEEDTEEEISIEEELDEMAFEEESILDEEEEGLSLDDDEIAVLEEDLSDDLDIALAGEPGMEEEDSFTQLKESGLEDHLVESQTDLSEEEADTWGEEDDSEVLNLDGVEEESFTFGELDDESFETENIKIELTEDNDESEELPLDSIPSDLEMDTTVLEEALTDEDDLDNTILEDASTETIDGDEMREEMDVSLELDDEDSFDEAPVQKLREGLTDIQLDLNDFEEEPLIGDYDDLSKQTVRDGLEHISLEANDFDPEMPESLLPDDVLEEQEYDYEITEIPEELIEMDNQVIELLPDEQGTELDVNEDHFILLDSGTELQKETIELDEEEDLEIDLESSDELDEEEDLEIDLESSDEESFFDEELVVEESTDLEFPTDEMEVETEESLFDEALDVEEVVESDEDSDFSETLDVEEVVESDEDFSIEESDDEPIELVDDTENKVVEAITKDDVFEEDLDGGGIFEDVIDTEFSMDDSLQAVEEKALSALNDLDQEMDNLEKKDHDLHLDDTSDSPTLVTESENTSETLEGESSEMALFHDELDESLENNDMDSDNSSIFNDSTEGEDMEIATESDILTAPPPIMETELELAEEDFNAPQTDQLVFQIDPEDEQQELLESNSITTTQQLGKLLEDVIASSVQKSLEQSIPSIVDQILEKMKDQS